MFKQPFLPKIFPLTKGLLAIIGLIAVILFTIGFIMDGLEFDQTSGGYDYPYENWTGTPVNFADTYTTKDGLFGKGRVLDRYINCNNGMISVSILGSPKIDWRTPSGRAKTIHKPQITCQERGFDTSSWDKIE